MRPASLSPTYLDTHSQAQIWSSPPMEMVRTSGFSSLADTCRAASKRSTRRSSRTSVNSQAMTYRMTATKKQPGQQADGFEPPQPACVQDVPHPEEDQRQPQPTGRQGTQRDLADVLVPKCPVDDECQDRGRQEDHEPAAALARQELPQPGHDDRTVDRERGWRRGLGWVPGCCHGLLDERQKLHERLATGTGCGYRLRPGSSAWPHGPASP